MSDCKKMVTDIYNHPDVLNLISKIKPESIRDDLRQEMAVSLLEQPCEKVASLFAGNNLLRYAMRICWYMATGKSNDFYYRFKRSDLAKAAEYVYLMQDGPMIPVSVAVQARQILAEKTNAAANNGDVFTDHEVRIFNRYIELGSCRAVAKFYGIPVNHTCNVINKIKKELRCILSQ